MPVSRGGSGGKGSRRRRLLAMTLLRSAATVVIMVTVYYVAPLDQPLSALTGIEFVGGLLALTLAVAWQLWAVLRSSIPRLRAIEAVAVGLPGLLLLYAAVYIVIATSAPNSFTEPLSRTDGLYFTVTVFATVGFGDIAPRSELSRILVTTQILTGLVAVGLVAKIVVGAVEVAVTRRGNPASDGPQADAPVAAQHSPSGSVPGHSVDIPDG
jgi:voltage-gated potassium channel